MRTTKRALQAEVTQLRAQLAAAQPESRQGLRRKLAETRKANEQLTLQNASLVDRVKQLTPAPAQ